MDLFETTLFLILFSENFIMNFFRSFLFYNMD